jgi:VWFA-related protein
LGHCSGTEVIGSLAKFAAFVLLFGAAGLCAQESTPVFRATTELVLLDVQVVHTKTRAAAPPLQSKDLRLFEEGVPQEIVHLSRDEFPLSVILLFDLTESVQPVLKRLAEGARSALAHFKPEDEVSVMVYASTAEEIDGFTTDRARTLRSIAKAARMKELDHETCEEDSRGAYFNEALYQAAAEMRRASSATNRRVVVWLTDNLANVPYHVRQCPVHTEIEAVQALHQEDTVVAPILMKSALWGTVLWPVVMASEAPWRKSYPPGDAHKYAEVTGGQAVGLRGKNPEERLAQLIDELRARYTVAYRPSEAQAAGSYRKVRVEVAPDGHLRPKEWTVRARQGYYRR